VHNSKLLRDVEGQSPHLHPGTEETYVTLT
jgi:hypothetical protein